ncbi:hypothetical protein [Apilactobacillus xinyiensis]|nr:hypothetical protein [Apilactobacillus xinyiensis]
MEQMNSKEIWESNNMAIELMKEQAIMNANQVGALFGGDKQK